MSRRKNKRDKRKDFLALVPPEAKRILDIGCAAGVLTAQLKKEGREIVGVDNSEEACERAKERLDQVFLADAQNLELPYPEGYFDCIIYADVLNSLIDPLSAIKKHSYYLAKGGYIIASMPNIRYYKVIIRLVFAGTWDYVKEGGTLWWYNLRFFTLINMKELYQDAGYKIIEIKRNIIAARGLKITNFFFFNQLKNFLAYQYYIKAQKLEDGPVQTPIRKRKIYQF